MAAPTSSGPGLDPESDLAWALHQLAESNQELDAMLAHRLGLGATEYLALKHLLVATQPMGPVTLGRVLGISSGSATALVDRLQASHHVRRIPHSSDRRRQIITVSPSARALLMAELEPIALDIAELAADLTAEQQRTVIAFLHALADRHRAAAREGADQ
jgi:DNA-binding MarR family transcriptional regulator